jgi:hypothetical protein
VLQHIEPRFVQGYLLEFLRILKPQGVLVFQLPSEPRDDGSRRAKPDIPASMPERGGIKGTLKRLLPAPLRTAYSRIRNPRTPRMEMHSIKREEVIRLLEAHGALILDIRESDSAGPSWVDFRYFVSLRPTGSA